MKLIKFLFVFFIVVLILLLASYGVALRYVNSKGKELVKSYIADTYNTEAHIGQINLSFPFTVVIKDFSCGDVSFSEAFLQLDRIKFSPVTPIFRKLQVDGVKVKVIRQKGEVSIKPFWHYRVTKSPEVPLLKKTDPQRKVDLASPVTEGASSPSAPPIPLVIKEVVLNNMTVDYTDYTFVPPIELSLHKTNVRLKDFNLPQLLMFYFDVTSSLESRSRDMPDILKAKGWIDWFYKNMDATVKVNRFDYLAFDKQYPQGFKAYDLDVTKAFLSLAADLKAQDNDLVINGEVIFDEVEFKEVPLNPDKVESLKNALLVLKKKDGSPYFELPQLTTKFDHPKIDMDQVLVHLQKLTFQSVGGVIDRVLKGETDIKDIEDDPAIKAIKDVFKGFEAIMKDKF